MPIYEYRCQDCGAEFEYQQRMSDDPKTVCENCSGTLERLISRTSFHLKGGGWYKDLYSSTKKESADSSAKESGDQSAKSPDSTSKSESSSSSSSASSSSGSSEASGGTSGK